MAEELAGPTGTDDWTARATDLLQVVVEGARSKTVVPLTKLARLLVLGLVLLVGSLTAAVLLVIALVRVIDSYLPVHPHARQVWVTYAGLGAIFVLIGVFSIRKGTPRPR